MKQLSDSTKEWFLKKYQVTNPQIVWGVRLRDWNVGEAGVEVLAYSDDVLDDIHIVVVNTWITADQIGVKFEREYLKFKPHTFKLFCGLNIDHLRVLYERNIK